MTVATQCQNELDALMRKVARLPQKEEREIIYRALLVYTAEKLGYTMWEEGGK